MEDFIFGTLSTDELKLIYQRANHCGIQHGFRINPLDPVADRPVSVFVQIGADLPADNVVCYYTLDGSQPAGSRGVAHNGQVMPLKRVSIEWDTFTWGYLTNWEAQLPPQPEGSVVRYRISAWCNQGDEVFADWPDVKLTIEEAARAFFQKESVAPVRFGDPSNGVTFTYHVDRLSAPLWARQAVIYHIFVDRFFPGKGKSWKQTNNLKSFIGGTLWGVLEKLDYIADLGATCIWLSPIFPSPTPHGYDATDYENIEPRLGGNTALRELVSAAHGLGLKIILDLVCNHLSSEHPIFQDALSNSKSRFRSWFLFDDPRFGYRTYFGVPSMPQINLNDPEAKKWMIDNACYWLREFDVDGFRLDHANGPGPGFWSDFWAACKKEKPEVFCFGEIVEPPPSILRYHGRMDGVLDFHLAEAIRKTFAYRTLDEEKFFQFIDRHQAFFPKDFLLLTFLDNHDMDRFLFIAKNNKSRLEQAASVQMNLPGPPIIYYGTEVGLSQTISKASRIGLEASRMPMLWGDDQDEELLNFYKAIIRNRFETKPWTR